MKISVVIPVYNNARYIENCIKSVLSQDVDVEIILINDNSTDDLTDILKKLSKENLLSKENFVFFNNNRNCGPAASRNKGIEYATGDYIAFLDADDWWEKDKLKKQIKLINEKKALFVYTSRKNLFEDGTEKILTVKEKINYEELLKGNQITCSSVVLRSDIAKKYLMIKDEIHEDYYMWLRILKDNNIAYGINEPLVNYRVQESSKSGNKLRSAIMTFKTLRLMNEPFFKCCKYFIQYAKAGIKKYK